MTVHLTRIYTRTGDAGTTALGNGERVPKTDPRIAAYADVDECNAAIGVALALGDLPPRVRQLLTTVQNDLFDVGADLCNPVTPDPNFGEAGGPKQSRHPPLRITEEYVTRLEGWCDELNADLPRLDSFILPGGAPGAALLHAARTVARRAERSAWVLYAQDPERTGTPPITYLNRLSDLLFILARVANPTGDVKWLPGGEREQ